MGKEYHKETLVPGKSQCSDTSELNWETAYAGMKDQTPMFAKLPSTLEDAKKVFAKCNSGHHIGPIVLAKDIPRDDFRKWIQESELGLHKAELLEDGTVFIAEACSPDHGILRGVFHKDSHFHILDETQAVFYETGSGTKGDMNPDVFWVRDGEPTANARVLIEVGVDQSLPSLRRRAHSLCGDNYWAGLSYVVLVKRYPTRHVYIEIWQREAPDPTANNNVSQSIEPQQLGVQGTMSFVSNAHAAAPGVVPVDQLAWQWNLQDTCTIPAGDVLHIGCNAISFDASYLLRRCKYE